MKRSIFILEIKPFKIIIALLIIVLINSAFLSSLSHSESYRCCCSVSGTLYLRCCGDDTTLAIGDPDDSYESCYYTAIEGVCTDEERFIRHVGTDHSNCGDCKLIDGTVDCASTTTTTTSENGDCIFKDRLGYGDPRLDVLRQFRDTVLRQTREGRELIKLYYQWSPIISKAMEGDEDFQEEIGEMIDGILPLIEGTWE